MIYVCSNLYIRFEDTVMKKDSQRKQHYLNRLIVRVALFGYITIAGLLFALVNYFLIDYQTMYTKEQQDLVQREIHDLANSLDTLKTYVYERWYGDNNFAKLSVYNSDRNILMYRYELMEELKLNLSVNQHISGFYVFYTGKENCVYITDNKQIMPEEAATLHMLLSAYHQSVYPADREYFLLASETGRYAVIGYTKGNATIYGLYSLNEALNNIHLLLPDGNRILLSSGPFQWMDEDGDLELAEEALSSPLSQVSYQKGWNSVIGKRIEGTDIRIVSMIPWSLRTALNFPVLFCSFLLAASVIMILYLIRYLRRELVVPLRELNQTMDSIRQGGDYHVEERAYSLRELDEINRTFGYMMEALKSQKVATYEETLEKQKARIQYLQLQVKPHFYLNSLKTINAMALTSDMDRLQEYLQRLSEHMRYLLSLERNEIMLGEELKFTENYVNLQRKMTGRKVEYSVYQDKENLAAIVPILCVQTFVENSIKHARLVGAEAVLKIKVEIYHLNSEGEEYLDIAVHDNGQGYPEEVLARLEQEPSSEGENVGVNNIRRRCNILYGDRVSFLFENRNGAVSEIIIPVLNKKGRVLNEDTSR